MTVNYDLKKYQTVSNSSNLTAIRGVYHDNITADLTLRVRSPPDTGPLDFALFGPAIKTPDGFEEGLSDRSPEDIFGIVQECRQTWQERVVDASRIVPAVPAGERTQLPFQEFWRLNNEPELLAGIAPYLARAGEKLFHF